MPTSETSTAEPSTAGVLVDAYEQVVAALSAVPAAQRELLLAKTVLLLAHRPERVDELRGALAAAARDLPLPHQEVS